MLGVEPVTRLRSIAVATFAITKLAVVLWLAFMAWTTSGWFIDDSIALRLDDIGWWQIAAKRFIVWTLVSAAVGAVAFLANRAVFSRCGYPKRAALVLSVGVAAIPLVGSFAGGAQFIVDRPFL